MKQRGLSFPRPPFLNVPIKVYPYRWYQSRRYGMFVCNQYFHRLHLSSQSSFGFGQVGGTALVVNPRYLFGALEPTYYLRYQERNRKRASHAYKAMSEMMIRNSLVKLKDSPPYTPEMERRVLLNSTARATLNGKTGSYEFIKLSNSATLDISNGKAVTDMISDKAYSAPGAVGIGVDHGKSEFALLERLLTSRQNSFLLCHRITRRSWNATSLTPRSLIVVLNHLPNRRLLLAGLAKRLYSNL